MLSPIPIIIDVEASGFGGTSYPIEVGIAMPNDERHSMLIKPMPDWVHWDHTAESLHGISRETLIEYGKSVNEVASFMNELLADETTFSDGWVVDSTWINSLFHAAGVTKRFRLSPIEQLMTESQMLRWDSVKLAVIDDTPQTRHRASVDAWIIQQTYLRSKDSIE